MSFATTIACIMSLAACCFVLGRGRSRAGSSSSRSTGALENLALVILAGACAGLLIVDSVGRPSDPRLLSWLAATAPFVVLIVAFIAVADSQHDLLSTLQALPVLSALVILPALALGGLAYPFPADHEVVHGSLHVTDLNTYEYSHSWHSALPGRVPQRLVADADAVYAVIETYEPGDGESPASVTLQSTDGGRSFVPANDRPDGPIVGPQAQLPLLSTDVSLASVYDTARPTVSDSAVYVAAHSGLWLYTPDNNECLPLAADIFEPAPEGFASVAVDPADPQRVLAGTLYRGAVLESPDRGKTWHVHPLGGRSGTIEIPPRPVAVTSLEFAPTGKVFAATANSHWVTGDDPPTTGVGLWRSDDGGSDWQRCPARGLSDTAVLDVAWIDDSGETALVATAIGLYRTIDFGDSFQRVPLEGSTSPVTAIATHSAPPRHVYVACAHGALYCSEDGGMRFHPINSPAEGRCDVRDVAVSPMDPHEILLVDFHGGLYRSTNGGLRWRTLSASVPFTTVQVTESPPIYIGTLCRGLWTMAEDRPADEVEPLQSRREAGRRGRIAEMDGTSVSDRSPSSQGSGYSPTPVEQPPGSRVVDYEVSPADPSVHYALDRAAGVLVSATAGLDWEGPRHPPPIEERGGFERRYTALAASSSDPARVWVGSCWTGELWESRDYGASWNRLPPVVATGAETGIDGTTITDLLSYAPADEPASEALVIATANVAIGTYLGALTAPGIEWSSILITAVFSASLFAAAGSVVLVGEQRFEHGSGRAFAWSLRLSGTLWMLMVVLIAGVAVLQGTRQPAVVPSVLSVGVVLYATGRRNRHRRVTHDESVVLAAVPSPALILGTGGEVIAANPRARRLLSLNGDLSHLPVSAEEGAIRVSLTGLGGEESQATCRPLPDQCGAPSGRYLCVFEPPDGAVDDAGAASDRLENYELTDRERDIVGFLIRGRTYREIGDALYISEATVRSHAHNVYRKTDTSNRAELISLFSHDPRVGRDR